MIGAYVLESKKIFYFKTFIRTKHFFKSIYSSELNHEVLKQLTVLSLMC